jgi:hypothetical protein
MQRRWSDQSTEAEDVLEDGRAWRTLRGTTSTNAVLTLVHHLHTSPTLTGIAIHPPPGVVPISDQTDHTTDPSLVGVSETAGEMSRVGVGDVSMSILELFGMRLGGRILVFSLF